MLTRGAQVTGVAVCSLCLTWISVSLRFYVRVFMLKFVGREDWLTLAAMLVFTVFCSLLLVLENYGLGAHMYAIPMDMKETALTYVFICELLYVVTTAIAKLSIGVFYLRLASKKYQVQIIYTTLGVMALFSTMYFIFLVFQCTPVNYLWDRYGKLTGTCIDRDILINVTYAHAAMSAVTDWSFGILPIFFVWKLQMTSRTKLSVILILSLGFFASSATIVRIVYIRQLQTTDDYSWFGINLVKWSMVEPAIGITAAAIATLRPLFANFLHLTQRKPPPAEKRMTVTMDSDGTRSSTGSRQASSCGSGQAYSAEFAEVLGLSRYGVTTHISAAKPPGWKERRRTRRMGSLGDEEGLTELSLREGDEGTWGIKATTEVVIE